MFAYVFVYRYLIGDIWYLSDICTHYLCNTPLIVTTHDFWQ